MVFGKEDMFSIIVGSIKGIDVLRLDYQRIDQNVWVDHSVICFLMGCDHRRLVMEEWCFKLE